MKIGKSSTTVNTLAGGSLDTRTGNRPVAERVRKKGKHILEDTGTDA